MNPSNPPPCPDCAQARAIVQEWMDQQGHDRCWYYPDLFRRLAALFRLTPKLEPKLPPRPEFEEGCRRYQAEEYAKR